MLEWDLSYTGTHQIHQQVDQSINGGMTWLPMMAMPLVDCSGGGCAAVSQSVMLDLRGFQPGLYQVRVSVHTDDAPDDHDEVPLRVSELVKTAKIRIG
jgi:hypothetical protein